MASLIYQIVNAALLLGLLIAAPFMYQPQPEQLDPPSGMVVGYWQPGGRPWHWPDEPLAPLEVSPLVCMLKTPHSPERVC